MPSHAARSFLYLSRPAINALLPPRRRVCVASLLPVIVWHRRPVKSIFPLPIGSSIYSAGAGQPDLRPSGVATTPRPPSSNRRLGIWSAPKAQGHLLCDFFSIYAPPSTPYRASRSSTSLIQTPRTLEGKRDTHIPRERERAWGGRGREKKRGREAGREKEKEREAQRQN